MIRGTLASISVNRLAGQPDNPSSSYCNPATGANDLAPEERPLKRSVFSWVGSANGGDTAVPLPHETITAEEVVSKYGVPKTVLCEYLEDEISEAMACKSLPFTLLLVVSYSMMVLQHMKPPIVRAVEEGTSLKIEETANFAYDSDYAGHKWIWDVHSHTDFWSFMNQGITPTLFTQHRLWSEDLLARNSSGELGIAPWEALDDRERGILTVYNRIVGGVRFRQERGSPAECDLGKETSAFFNRSCITGTLSYQLPPDPEMGRQTDADESYTRWLYTHRQRSDLERQLLVMEANGWLSRDTAKVEIAIPIYNAEYGVHTYLQVNFFFSRGGAIFKQVITQSCYASWYTSYMVFVPDAIYAVCILYIFFGESMEVCSTLLSIGCRGLVKEYFNFFNLVDWISVVTGFVIMVWWVQIQLLTIKLNEKALAFGEVPKPIDPRVVDVPEAREYMEQLEITVNFVTMVFRWLSRYPLVVLFRLFKSFHAQPRLALVTKTLRDSMVDTFHFAVVFCSVLLGFVTSAVILFGLHIGELANMPRGITWCLRLLFGDIEYDDMRESGRDMASVWLMLFLLVAGLLLLNMLVAIVMDTYSSVKGAIGNAETLAEELGQVVSRTIDYYKGDFVPLEHILKSVQGSPAKREVLRQVSEDSLDCTEFDSKAQKSVGTVSSYAPSGFENKGHHRDGHMTAVFMDSEGHEEMNCLNVDQLIRITGEVTLPRCAVILRRRGNMSTTMHEKQAHEILHSAVLEYYQQNKGNSDIWEYIRLGHKIGTRVKKILKMDPVAHSLTGSTMSLHSSPCLPEAPLEDPSQLLSSLQPDIGDYVNVASAQRLRSCTELARLRTEVSALREQLQRNATLPVGSLGPALASLRRPSGSSSSGTNTAGASGSSMHGHEATRDRALLSRSGVNSSGTWRLAPLREEPAGESAWESDSGQSGGAPLQRAASTSGVDISTEGALPSIPHLTPSASRNMSPSHGPSASSRAPPPPPPRPQLPSFSPTARREVIHVDDYLDASLPPPSDTLVPPNRPGAATAAAGFDAAAPQHGTLLHDESQVPMDLPARPMPSLGPLKESRVPGTARPMPPSSDLDMGVPPLVGVPPPVPPECDGPRQYATHKPNLPTSLMTPRGSSPQGSSVPSPAAHMAAALPSATFAAASQDSLPVPRRREPEPANSYVSLLMRHGILPPDHRPVDPASDWESLSLPSGSRMGPGSAASSNSHPGSFDEEFSDLPTDDEFSGSEPYALSENEFEGGTGGTGGMRPNKSFDARVGQFPAEITPHINPARVAGGVGLMREEGGSAPEMGDEAEPGPPRADYEFTSFRDAQSQLRRMLERHRG